MKKRVAILGSGNIGTDLLIKLQRSDILDPVYMVGIDESSAGLQRAKELGVKTTTKGLSALVEDVDFAKIDIVFDATSAAAHEKAWPVLESFGKSVIDLTPAAIGPYCIPTVNTDVLTIKQSLNVNLVTCGGQATVPIVAACAEVTPVHYAEIVASISSKSAGPGTRANIDEFTKTTAKALEVIGQAEQGKAIIVLNPAEPALMMRNTVYCLVDEQVNEELIKHSIEQMAQRVSEYVPGYRIVNGPVFETVTDQKQHKGTKITTFIEVTGKGDFLPSYAGNLDIMTAAAVRAGETVALSL